MTARTGVPSLILVAREVCRLLVKYAPRIKELYPANTTLHDALDAALIACQALEAALIVVREYGD